MRYKFDSLQNELKKKITEMGDLVHIAIQRTIQSLKERDLELAEKIVADDSIIDNLETEIEQLCTHLVATQQPIATDLRKIVSSYKIIFSLERMGDLAADIANISLRIGPVPLMKPLIDLPAMAELVISMMHTALKAFINEDVELARSLAELDHQVDRYYKLIFDEIIDLITKDPKVVSQGVYLLLVTRYIERIGDYCTNIGEEVIYIVLGIREDLNK